MSDKKRILLVAHGANHSTVDIYNYYKESIRPNNDVLLHSFPYHRVMEYHHHALKAMNMANDENILIKSIHAASRDIITDIALFEPHHVLCVGGLAIPDKISSVIYNFRDSLKTPYMIGYIFTESPYEDKEQEIKLQLTDYALFNDKYSAEKYNPNNEYLIKYLPHAYYPAVHYKYTKVDKYDYDVLFCGTLYPERVNFFNSIDLSGIKSMIVGSYSDYTGEKIESAIGGQVDNINLANFYRKSKLVINFHRDGHGVAYSMNPRIREAIACGSLPVSDYRKEIVDIFGDTIPVFSSSEDANRIIKHLVANEEERRNRVDAAFEKMKDHTYENGFNKIILPLMSEGEKILWES